VSDLSDQLAAERERRDSARKPEPTPRKLVVRPKIFDPAEVAKTLSIVRSPTDVFEVRALNAQLKGDRFTGTVYGYFDSAEACIAELSKIQSAEGIYITLNPVVPALLARAHNRLKYARKGDPTTVDKDIARRCRLLIDVDPIRPAGVSASDAEKQAAMEKASLIWAFLRERGWPEPVFADSGNGAHLIYSVDLPSEDKTIEHVLHGLAARFDDDDATLDITVHNPSRIVKLHGTLAAKGDHIAERPHRQSRIISAPESSEVVSPDTLGSLVKELQPPPTQPDKTRTATKLPSRSNDKPDREQIRSMLAAIPGRPGHADWTSYIAAVSDALSDSEAIGVLQERWPAEKEGEYEFALKHRKKDIHIGSLIHAAQQHGWTFPKPTEEQKAEKKKLQRDQLPHSVEAEQGIVSLILQSSLTEHSNDVIAKVATSLQPWFFYDPQTKALYEVLLSLYRDGIQADQIAFRQILRDRNLLESVGGSAYVADAFGFASADSNVQWYIDIVREKFILRETITTGTRIVSAAYGARDDQAAELLADFGLKIERIKRYAGWSNGVKPLQPNDLLAMSGQRDPNNIVGWRWQCRGGNCLWSGGAGYGKSTLVTQFAIYWATGERCFGVKPVRALKSLIIQSENDDFDVAEQYNGVLSGIQLDDDSRALVDKNVTFVRVEAKSGRVFLMELERLLALMRPDLVWIDPLFAFAGCDLMNAEKTGYFLREGLFPLFTKFECSGNIIHHIAKPPKEEKADKPVIDYQYSAFGSSEIQNAFRAVNTLHPISFSEQIYKLVFSKRGRRARAKTLDGSLTSQIYVQQSDDPNAIYWTQVDEPEKPEKKGALKYTDEHILGHMSVATGWKTTKLQKHVRDETGMSSAQFYRIWPELQKAEKIRVNSEGEWFKK
jgi:hypothetical protein